MPVDMREVRRNLQLLVRHGQMTRSEADRRLKVWEANKDRPEPEFVEGRSYEISLYGADTNLKAYNEAETFDEAIDAISPTLDERSQLRTFRGHYAGKTPWPGVDGGMDLFHQEPGGRPIYVHPLDLVRWAAVDDA